jgi:hypothetical protein
MLDRISKAAALLSLIALPGCSSETTGPAASAPGTYRLQTVNGEPAPFLLGESEGHNVEVIEGTIEVRADQTCAFAHTYKLTSLETSEVTERVENEPCTWTSNTIAIHLRFSDGGTISGVFGFDSLWFDYNFEAGAMRFAYYRGTPIGLPLD